MFCLGIECTAHTIGIGIVDEKCNILANEKKSYITKKGGIIPIKAAEHHKRNFDKLIMNSLKKAKIKIKEIDLIAFSQGPGLAPCLIQGMNKAMKLSKENKIPLIGVNHCLAHIEIGKKKTLTKNPIIVYASGPNTQIIGFKAGKYRVYGETIDSGIGNTLDSFARELGIGFPGGPILDKMYFKSKKYIKGLPYTVKGMDLAYSGILTAAIKKIKKEKKQDLVYSFMHNAFAMLTEVTERALAHSEKNEVLLAGGVAASKALNEMLTIMCKERKAKLFKPETSLCGDNGVMIAWLGIIMHKSGLKQDKFDIKPKQRIDQIKVNWVN